MSCNIKPAVSESSQLSVSLVVLACRAAHLCLLDKTCSTLPRENTLSPSLFLFLLCFLSLCFSPFLSLPLSVLLAFLAQSHFFISPLFLFYKSNTARCSVHFIFSGFPPPLLYICYPFVSLLHPHPLSIFILYYFGTSLSALRFESAPSLRRRCSSLLCTWLSTRAGHAHAAATRLIETCVSKLLMFTEALYRR